MESISKILVIAATMLLSACVASSDESVAGEDCVEILSASGENWRDRYLMLGKETYERACAACHDDGENGAPAIRIRADWSDRSPLWSAVLLEHAKSGYLEMPARGGHPDLTDLAVEAAGEYMLGETFPELLVD